MIYEVCTLDIGSYDAVTRRLSRNVIPTPTCPPHPLPTLSGGASGPVKPGPSRGAFPLGVTLSLFRVL